jgi:nicotinate-nucleotide--dimethylbenzimidazole phosphoribosyltransferase
VADSSHITRPPTPTGFDPSRAAERAADPDGWRYPQVSRDAIYQVISERRDIRRFRPDPVPDEVLRVVLAAAHRAPSVGLMQPWRFIVIRNLDTRVAVRQLAQRERLRQAANFDERRREFLDQKIEGIVEAPVGIVVCCDHGDAQQEILGRGTIPETDLYSTACAVQNLWLAARAEGLGIGWVSFYRPHDLRQLLAMPGRVDPIAYLCVGWPDERPVRPGLEAAGWAERLDLDAVVMEERWRHEPSIPAARVARRRSVNREAAASARDRFDRLVKPAGSLGALEPLVERWASIAGHPPPSRLHAGVLICAADHGHTRRGTSLFNSAVSLQVTAAAARGETAVAVLARHGGHRLLVADIGLTGATPTGARNAKVAAGTADMVEAPAMTAAQLHAAVEAGATLAGELLDDGVDCLVLGEIGIGNTATAAALVSALTGAPPAETVGRGTGLDAAGLARKRDVVAAALEQHAPFDDIDTTLAAVGGLEFCALVGAATEASRRGVPVILDGYAVTAAALAAVRRDPTIGEALIASHRGAEAGHDLVLAELGLEPLLDLRLRLGEASGALLALPVIASAGALHAEMATFEESDVDRAH